jgi:Tfp pilus assembly protein PilF
VSGAAVAGGHLWGMAELARAEAALDEARFDDARGHLRWCLRLWPLSTSTHLFAAHLERLGQNFPQAAAYLERCQELQGGATEATQAEWLCLRTEGGELDKNEAGLLQAVQAGGPFTALYLEALARANYRLHRLSKVRICINLWLKEDPQSVRAWMFSAAIHELQLSPEGAAAAYLKVLEMRPRHWRARLRLANVYLYQKQPEEAAVHLQHVQREHAADRDVAVALAHLYVLQNKDREAAEQLDCLLQQDPSDADVLLLRGQLECEAGHPDRGAPLLDQAVQLRPKNAAALWQYYRCLQQQGGRVAEAKAIHQRYKTAADAIQRLTDILHNDMEMRLEDPELLTEAGRLFGEIGQEQAGVEFFYRALHSDPGFIKAHRALVDHFAKTGDTARAAQHRDALTRLERPSPRP